MFESIHEFWYRIRARFNRDAMDAELVEELRVHAEFLEEEAMRNGASPEDARRTTSERLGNMTNIRESTRDRWSFGWVEALLQDTRYAFRFLRRSPGFTLVAVLSLALGVGANATVFAVADRLMFSAPPHVANADRLYELYVKRESKGAKDEPEYFATTYFPEYFALLDQAKSFSSIVLYTSPVRARLGKGPDVPRIRTSMATANYFDVLGVKPVRGRFFLPEDERESNSEHAAVISYGFWQTYLSGADSAVGMRFQASDLNYVVIGIAPREFSGVELDAADMWTPLGALALYNIGPDWKTRPFFSPHVLVRLRDDVLPTSAAAEATVIINRYQDPRRAPSVEEKTVLVGSIITARSPLTQTGAVQVSSKLILASSLVLLAACANLANLLLVRALTRRREIALRMAIGISRARLASQMLLESLIIAFLGSAVALVFAHWSGEALRALVFPELQWATAAVNARVFVYSVACGTSVAALATLIPAIRMTRSDVSAALRSSAHQLTASTGRLRRSLLALQVALAVLLIVGASAFSRSLSHAYELEMGIDVHRLISGRYSLEEDSLSAPSRLALLEEAARRVRTIPGIEAATVANSLPLTGNNNSSIRIPEGEFVKPVYAAWWPVTPAFQNMAGFHLIRGRWITSEDVAAGMQPVVLISETLAGKLWPGQDPIDRCLRRGADTTPCLRVIGMVRDLRIAGIREASPPTMLVSETAPSIKTLSVGYVVIRVKDGYDVDKLVVPVRAALHNVRRDITSIEVKPLAQALDRHIRPLALGATTFGSFALLAVILSAIGLYGILSFSVTQRTNEFGIRSALGAQARDLVMSVVREGVAVVVAGIALGVALSWYASTAIAALLFQASARDAAPYAYATLVLIMVALIASIVPALRATRVDPAIALRAE